MVNAIAISELLVAVFGFYCYFSVLGSWLARTIILFSLTAGFGFFKYSDTSSLGSVHFFFKQLAGSVGICALVLGVLDALRYEIPSFVSPVATIVSLSLTFVTIISGKESLLKPIQIPSLLVGILVPFITLVSSSEQETRAVAVASLLAFGALAVRDTFKSLFPKPVAEVGRRLFVAIAMYAIVCVRAGRVAAIEDIVDNAFESLFAGKYTL